MRHVALSTAPKIIFEQTQNSWNHVQGPEMGPTSDAEAGYKRATQRRVLMAVDGPRPPLFGGVPTGSGGAVYQVCTSRWSSVTLGYSVPRPWVKPQEQFARWIYSPLGISRLRCRRDSAGVSAVGLISPQGT